MFLVYDLASGLIIREANSSIAADAASGLPEHLGVIKFEGTDYSDYFVDTAANILSAKSLFQDTISASSVPVGDSIRWSNLPADTGVFVDGVYIGKTESDGVFELEPEEVGTYTVKFMRAYFKTKEYTVHAT